MCVKNWNSLLTMSDDRELLSELEELEKSSSLFVSKPSLIILLKNSLPVANFIQFLSFFCTFPHIIPLFSNLSPFKIDPNNFDLSKCDLKNPNDINLLNQLNTILPNIKKVKILTKKFHSNVNDILRTFADYKYLESFDIQLDTVDENYYLNVPFRNLNCVSIKINNRRIKNIHKAIYLVNNILRFTRKLTEITLYNVLINDQISLSLSYNVNLKTIKFINCRLHKGPKRNFKMLFNIPLFEKINIQEFEDESNSHITEILFDQIPHSKVLRNIKDITFNVFDTNFIKYENIKFCSSLEKVTLTYFDRITPSFVQIFKNLVGTLNNIYNYNPFILSIEKVVTNYQPTDDSTYEKIYNDFEIFIEDLDGFGLILYSNRV